MKRPEVHVVEAGKRLSQSLIWRLQRRFFEKYGVAAFSHGALPHYITSNPFIAQAYARVVLGYLRDIKPQLRPGQPVYLVELGAGTGRFGFHFLQKFSALLAQSTLHDIPWCYVLTDFTTSYLNAWLTHPKLMPFVAAGNLDFALFDVSQPGSLVLQHSGAVLSENAVQNPLIVLANYVFDGIPQDAFRLMDGQLYESLVTLTSFQPESDLESPSLLERLEVLYDSQLVTGDYYEDAACNRLLHSYAQGPQEGMLLFPGTTISCLGYLQKLSGNRLLLLTADKGEPTEEVGLPQSAPELVHHGSVSMMVNYRALGEYVQQEGGQVLGVQHRHVHLNVSAFVLGTEPAEHPETRHAYVDSVRTFGPDDFFLVKQSLEGRCDGMTLEPILALLRFSGWDFWFLRECFSALLHCLAQATEPWRQEARRAITAVWDNYYDIGEHWDLPYHLGMLLQTQHDDHAALTYFRFSIEQHGPRPETLHALALCHERLGDTEAAQQLRKQALMGNNDGAKTSTQA